MKEDRLKIGENIIRMRHQKGVTQEELADFVGVTKAAVSKWENQQSMPDVSLLPLLAAFFDVSIDELIGYEPQLDREQIREIYHGLAADFAGIPFEEALEKSRKLVQKYYSCYPFLFQISLLWFNHFMLVDDPQERQEILQQADELCRHICSNCTDAVLCSDAMVLQAYIDLNLGRAEDVIEALEETISPYRFRRGSEGILVQAYRMAGEEGKADRFLQFSMLGHLISLVGHAVGYLELHEKELSVCEETIRRIDRVGEIYQLAELDGNAAALFQLQAAIVYAQHKKKDQALERLEWYAAVVRRMFDGDNLTRHGDDYFNKVSVWYDQCELGNQPPRSRKVILDSARQIFDYPVFADLAKEERFQKIRCSLEKIQV